MTIDYAHKPQPSPKRRRLWLTAIVVIVLVLALPALFYVHYLHMPHLHPQPKIIHKHNTKAQTTQQALQLPQKQFDFYAMLPKMQVDIKQTKPNAIQLAPNQPYFLLQVATSSNQEAAQNLVTKLGVMGLDASLKTIKKNNSIRYQIVVGPYLLPKNATTDQAYLRSNHIDSILLKIKN